MLFWTTVEISCSGQIDLLLTKLYNVENCWSGVRNSPGAVNFLFMPLSQVLMFLLFCKQILSLVLMGSAHITLALSPRYVPIQFSALPCLSQVCGCGRDTLSLTCMGSQWKGESNQWLLCPIWHWEMYCQPCSSSSLKWNTLPNAPTGMLFPFQWPQLSRADGPLAPF